MERTKTMCSFGKDEYGLQTGNVKISELDDADAVIAMIDSNLQRENIKPSEKTFAYKMKLEAMKSQG